MPAAEVIDTIKVGDHPVDLAISADGTMLYCLNRFSGTLSRIDTKTRAAVSTLQVGSSPQAIDVGPDGSLFIADSVEDRVAVVRPGAAEVKYAEAGDRPVDLAISRDGKVLYCVNFLSGDLSIIDATTLSTVRRIGLGKGPSGIAISPDGQYIYVTNRQDNTLSVIGAQTGAVLDTIEISGGPTKIVIFSSSNN
jgi:YVTN family beta-propeller protein